MSFQHTETDLPLENEYPKLIRDRIPELVRQKGVEPSIRKANSNDEYAAFVLKKVAEEAQELSKAETESNLIEEIADVYEIIDALIKAKQLSPEEIAAVKKEKRQKRGGFDDQLIMLELPKP